MTNESRFTELKKDLEREALVAIKRIESISLSFKTINDKLMTIHKLLDAVLIINPATSKIDISKMKEDIIKKKNEIVEMKEDTSKKTEDITKMEEYVNKPIFLKYRNELEDSPTRLWFKMHGLYYYIEFIIRCAKNDEKNLEGCFIYGMSYYKEKDKVEDKPIISFFIDDHDIIMANNDFEDKSWTCEEKHIIDLHIRTLDKIWEEALYLMNNGKY